MPPVGFFSSSLLALGFSHTRILESSTQASPSSWSKSFDRRAKTEQSRASFWTTLSDVLLEYALPFALCLYDVLYGIAQGAGATFVWRDIVGFPLHFSSRVFHGNGKAAGAHGGQINYIVTDERGFFRFEIFPGQNFLQAGACPERPDECVPASSRGHVGPRFPRCAW